MTIAKYRVPGSPGKECASVSEQKEPVKMLLLFFQNKMMSLTMSMKL